MTALIITDNCSDFLRMDTPLCCRTVDELANEPPVTADEGGPLPLSRVEALVSMMAVRDHRVQQQPCFLEFDMSIEVLHAQSPLMYCIAGLRLSAGAWPGTELR